MDAVKANIMRLRNSRVPANVALATAMVKGLVDAGKLHPGWMPRMRFCPGWDSYDFDTRLYARCDRAAIAACPNCGTRWCGVCKGWYIYGHGKCQECDLPF